jgi:hypothetical protein
MELLADGVFSGSSPLREGTNGAGPSLALLMDELAHGVLVTSLENQVLHANQAARHELARRRVLGVRNQQLHGCSPDDCKALQEAVTKVGQGKRSLVTLTAPDGFSLTMAVLPLKGDDPSERTRAAFMFARASVCESSARDTRRRRSQGNSRSQSRPCAATFEAFAPRRDRAGCANS